MNFAAEHVGFVVAAYGISVIVLLAVALWIFTRARNLREELSRRNLSDPGDEQP